LKYCPKCDELLIPTRDAGDPQWICPQCRSRLVPTSALERRLSAELARTLRARIAVPAARSGPLCSKCTRPMRRLALEHGDDRITVDACPECDLVLLERGELERLPRKERYEAASADAATLQRELAKEQVRLEYARHRIRGGVEDLTWPQRLRTWFGLPVDLDAPQTGATPCTWTIAGLLVVAFLIELADPDGIVRALGWIPDRPLRLAGLTVLTSFFLHGGWFHLLGNLYFLVTFGRGVEMRIGAGRMLLMLAAADVVGNLMHAAFDPSSGVPCIGASGGISALLLYYAASLPWNRIAVTFWLLIRPLTFEVPAMVWAFFWFGWQAFLALIEHYSGGSVSALSHVGGALVGLAAFFLWRRRHAALAES
jgi:membrane associated rhomboid family serine protease